jgi:2-polyprenyl-3-methyl-5-hydroxy-6-metoxy-1,4-benzoquinol methylase
MVRVIKNSFGYYEVAQKPSAKELEEYYKKKYYQETQSKSYESSYSSEELDYFNNKIEEKIYVIERIIPLDKDSTVLDIGCGEGWLLKFLAQRGIHATGIDYSRYACEKFNPECLKNFIEGDIYEILERLKLDGAGYSVIWLDNVLEHVLEPGTLLSTCRELLKPKGVLMVEVPNDFSVLQEHLLKNNHIDNDFWVVLPDHLSYFNRNGLKELAKAVGLKEIFAMGDFPIDINLLNSNTNYNRDRSKGKSCYEAKYRFENLIHSVSVPHAVDFYKALIELGIGRCLISFFQRQ